MAQPGIEAGLVDPDLIAGRPPIDRIDLGRIRGTSSRRSPVDPGSTQGRS